MPASIRVDTERLKALKEAFGNSASKVKSELRIAINETLKATGTQVARIVTEELTAKVSVVKKAVRPRRAKNTELKAILTVKKEKKLPLKEFQARHIKKGVSYKINKREGTKLLPGAFQGGKPGKKTARWSKNVMMRVGASKTPIQVKYGVSPWGVYVKKNKDVQVRWDARKRLRKEIDERIRVQMLRQSGVIK